MKTWVLFTAFVLAAVPALAENDNIIDIAVRTSSHIDKSVLSSLEDVFSGPFRKMARCYQVLQVAEVGNMLSEAQLEQSIGDRRPVTDASLGMINRFSNAHYLAILDVSKLGNTSTVAARVLDLQHGHRVVITVSAHKEGDLDAALDLVEDVAKRAGEQMPCSLEITGRRQWDLSKLPTGDGTMLKGPLVFFNAAAPLGFGGEPELSGTGTQIDTIKSADMKFSADQRMVSGNANWTSRMDAPSVTLKSERVDASMNRAPYTLTFSDKEFSGTLNGDIAHVEIEWDDTAVAEGGKGSGTVTAKNELAALVGLQKEMKAILEQVGAGAAAQQAEEAVKSEAAKNGMPVFNPDSPTNTVTLPMPGQQDAAYFKLAFDINVRDDDQKRFAATDTIGPYDYDVKIIREKQ